MGKYGYNILLDRYGWGLSSVDYLSRLINLMKKGYLKENGTTLWIDTHMILYWDTERLARVKKLVYIIMRLGLATTIRFNIWKEDEDSDNLSDGSARSI